MAALWNRAGHYISILRFLLLSFYLLSFFSVPNLSHCRLDVYHTSTHGVALVRIYNAGLECAASGSLEMRDAKMTQKNRHLGTIAQLCQAESSQLRHASTIGQKLVKQQCLPHKSSQYGDLRPTNGWDWFGSLGHPNTLQRVLRLGSVTAPHSSSWRQPKCGVEQRAPPIFGRAAIIWASAHISSFLWIHTSNILILLWCLMYTMIVFCMMKDYIAVYK